MNKDEFKREVTERFQRKIERWLDGDGEAGIDLMLYVLAITDHPPIPEEAMNRLRIALMKWQAGEAPSLDRAFGVETGKTAQMARRKRELEAGARLGEQRAREALEKHNSGKSRRARHPFEGENDPLEIVAQRFRLSRSTLFRLIKDE
ncbi:MAG: hypothetical protein U5S82_14045 [Gammaproteobacteria bacterium]|nr:hypothetical protein [Gammaproteobacteria bacterium]